MQDLRRPGDQVLIADQVGAVLSLWPGATEIPDRAIAQKLREVVIRRNVLGPKGATSELLVVGEHGTEDISKIANQKNLFRLGIELPDEPGKIVGAMLLRHVFHIRLTLAGRDAQIGLLGVALAESGQIFDVVATHPFLETRRHRDRLRVKRVVADPLLVGLEAIGLC